MTSYFITKENLSDGNDVRWKDISHNPQMKHELSRKMQSNGLANNNTSQCERIAKTLSLTFGLVALGIFLELAGPTLPYLKLRLGTEDDEDMAEVLVARSVGNLIGSLLGGYLCNSFETKVDMFFSLSYLLAAIGTGAAPWCEDKMSMGFMFFFQGFAQGCICTGGNAIVIQMWGDTSGAPLVSQHFGFGIGALIAPQLAKAFIYEEIETTTSAPVYTVTANDLMSSLAYEAHSETFTQSTETLIDEIEIAYFISAMINVVFTIIFMVFFIKRTKVQTTKNDVDTKGEKGNTKYLEVLSPGSCTNGDTVYGLIFFSLLFVLFIHIVGGERAYSKYLYTFLTEGNFNYSSDKASDLNSLFWLFFTLGRGINLIAAHFISPVILMIIEVIFNVINGAALAGLGRTDETALWVFSCSFGMFLSPVFPTSLVWANLYVQMTAVAVSVAYVGSAVGGIVYQYLLGFLFDNYGEDTLMYVILGYSINLALVYLVMQIVASKHGKRVSNTTGIQRKDTNMFEGKEGLYYRHTTEL